MVANKLQLHQPHHTTKLAWSTAQMTQYVTNIALMEAIMIVSMRNKNKRQTLAQSLNQILDITNIQIIVPSFCLSHL
jgi:hypothetical protein